MAVFQKNQHHEDTVEKTPISYNDIQFLRELQTELNTQDNMGNADPVFWVIKGKKAVRSEDKTGTACLHIHESGTEYRTLNEIFHDLRTHSELSHIISNHGYLYRNLQLHADPSPIQINGRTSWSDKLFLCLELTGNDGEDVTKCELQDLTQVMDMLSDMDITDDEVELLYEDEQPYVYPDTFFLAHADAQDHLARYGYNYDPSAHAYAMTAVRSERFNHLLHILRTTDWTNTACLTTKQLQEAIQAELSEINDMQPEPNETDASLTIRKAHWRAAIRAFQYRLNEMTERTEGHA